MCTNAWCQPLGALLLTLAADDVDVDRARIEVEELKRALNADAGLYVPEEES